ncbi:hypothetical protein K435DRAFT_800531 [Dendrothele bispora CBS 962.96]|uniref:Uncharacterized protein n=1 Tax=Dendrothele bispora (strain CBS 962.96) TaxID=1314807 RepID=A0A4S8LSE8_DENBC|nr:hypothetical protein K435DRAFT_800531 [Dendrothele bispora CBS 962.96]
MTMLLLERTASGPMETDTSGPAETDKDTLSTLSDLSETDDPPSALMEKETVQDMGVPKVKASSKSKRKKPGDKEEWLSVTVTEENKHTLLTLGPLVLEMENELAWRNMKSLRKCTSPQTPVSIKLKIWS